MMRRLSMPKRCEGRGAGSEEKNKSGSTVLPRVRCGLRARLVLRMRHVRLEVDREAVNVAGAHDQRMIADERLQIVNLAVVRAIRGIGADDFGLLPDALEIILRDAAPMTLRPERERAGDVVFRMRRGDRERVAEFVQRDLLLDGVGEFAADF